MKLSEGTWSQSSQVLLNDLFKKENKSFQSFLYSSECKIILDFLKICREEGKTECVNIALAEPELGRPIENEKVLLKYIGGGLQTINQLIAVFSKETSNEEEDENADYLSGMS